MDGIPTEGQSSGCQGGTAPYTHAHIYTPQSASGPAPRPRPALTSSLHHLVELALDVQLRVLRFHTFELDGNFFTRGNIGTCQGRRRAQGTWVTLSQAAGLRSGPSRTSVPEQLCTPWGTTEERQRALHCIQGKWRDCGQRADPWASWGGRGGWEEQHVRGEGREELRTQHRATGWCSQNVRCEGRRDGLQTAHRSRERNFTLESGSP